jgi:hypothetical protein
VRHAPACRHSASSLCAWASRSLPPSLLAQCKRWKRLFASCLLQGIGNDACEDKLRVFYDCAADAAIGKVAPSEPARPVSGEVGRKAAQLVASRPAIEPSMQPAKVKRWY